MRDTIGTNYMNQIGDYACEIKRLFIEIQTALTKQVTKLFVHGDEDHVI